MCQRLKRHHEPVLLHEIADKAKNILPNGTPPLALTAPPAAPRSERAEGRHEFRVDWIGDRFAQYVIDFRPRSRAEKLPKNLVDRHQLAGVARPPQSRSCALIE
jgi:hypothetical protein